MEFMEIIMALLGIMITSYVVVMVLIVVIGIVWWVFKVDMRVEINSESWEEE